MRMKVPLADIVGIEAMPPLRRKPLLAAARPRRYASMHRAATTPGEADEINVIGCTVEEATRRVDKFLDQAALAAKPRCASFMATAPARFGAGWRNF